MPTAGATTIDRFIVIFPAIVFEALPFIVLGALISGTLEVLLPQKFFASLLPKRRTLAIGLSALLGIIFPMCECGIVLVMRRLLGKGLPLGCAIAYMLAAPIINPVVMMSTWAAFSGEDRIDGITSEQMLSLRVGGAFFVAVTVGLIVNRLAARVGVENLIKPIRGLVANRPTEEAPETEAGPRMSLRQKLVAISEITLHDFIDITCYLILGALLAALVQSFDLVRFAPGLAGNAVVMILFMMLLAVVLCLCSEADAFVAANFPIPAEMALGAKLAFLLLGPMLDLKLYVMYTQVLKSRLIWTIIFSVVGLVFAFTVAVHYLNAPTLMPLSTAGN